MGCRSILTQDNIHEARELKLEGWSNRRIAEYFGVSKTTIWDNVYRTRPYIRKPTVKHKIYSYRKLKIVVLAVKLKRAEGSNSLQVSEAFNIPLEEVNYIYGHFV